MYSSFDRNAHFIPKNIVNVYSVTNYKAQVLSEPIIFLLHRMLLFLGLCLLSGFFESVMVVCCPVGNFLCK